MPLLNSIAKHLGVNTTTGSKYSFGDSSTVMNDPFIYDSQVNVDTQKTLLTRLQETTELDERLNEFTTLDTVQLSQNIINNPYTSGIDTTDTGDITAEFIQVLNKYTLPDRLTYVTSNYFQEGGLEPPAAEVSSSGSSSGASSSATTTKKKKKEPQLEQSYITTSVVPSIFNPYYGIKTTGMHSNRPLLDDGKERPTKDAVKTVNTSDCSILALLNASKKSSGSKQMGSAIYRLADFLYCKDLGKVSNNHLLTLRRYTVPVGDNIYSVANTDNVEDANVKNTGKGNMFSMAAPDVGRLITWFGTEDNKLSDILNMSWHADWKEMNAEINQQASQADSSDRGVLGMIFNTANPSYNKAVGAGYAGGNNLFSHILGNKSVGPVHFRESGQYENNTTLYNYDSHKIYEPKNTIRSNHYYDGKLVFAHEFKITFKYQLRAYGNLNSKAVMGDLINNILAVTYTKGSFWGGKNQVVGAPGSDPAIRKANAFIDNTFDKLWGFMEGLASGQVSWQSILGSIADAAGTFLNGAKDFAKKAKDEGLGSIISGWANTAFEWAKTHNIPDNIKGQLKNALGRPALYAFPSILDGSNTGLWHLTVGNPFNPIVSFGNLIITNTDFSISDGALGLDDFPTEIAVTVSLKHARPRDMVDIGKMFTKGEVALGIPLSQGGWTRYYSDDISRMNTKIDKHTIFEDSYQQIFGTTMAKRIDINFGEISHG